MIHCLALSRELKEVVGPFKSCQKIVPFFSVCFSVMFCFQAAHRPRMLRLTTVLVHVDWKLLQQGLCHCFRLPPPSLATDNNKCNMIRRESSLTH